MYDHVEGEGPRRLLAQMAAEPMLAGAEECQQALQDYLQKLRQRRHQTQLRGLQEQIREAERRGDAVAQQRLLQEYTTLSKERGRRSSHGKV
jgi:hypothetical protein